jgi:hypothetical protein
VLNQHLPEFVAGMSEVSAHSEGVERGDGLGNADPVIIATEMTAVTLDVCMAKLEDASDQMAKRLDNVHGDVQELRGEIHTELQKLRTELQTGMRSQFWQFAALVLPPLAGCRGVALSALIP